MFEGSFGPVVSAVNRQCAHCRSTRVDRITDHTSVPSAAMFIDTNDLGLGSPINITCDVQVCAGADAAQQHASATQHVSWQSALAGAPHEAGPDQQLDNSCATGAGRGNVTHCSSCACATRRAACEMLECGISLAWSRPSAVHADDHSSA